MNPTAPAGPYPIVRLGEFTRGFLRIGFCLAAVWFVFWTCAYVIRPPVSENAEPPITTGISFTTGVILAPFFIAAVAIGVRWIISGFRSER